MTHSFVLTQKKSTHCDHSHCIVKGCNWLSVVCLKSLVLTTVQFSPVAVLPDAYTLYSLVQTKNIAATARAHF